MKMKMKMLTGTILVFLCLVSTGCPEHHATGSDGRTLEEAVRQNLDWTQFDKTRLDEHFLALVASGAGRRFFTRDNVDAFREDAKKNNRIHSAIGFKVLKKDESNTSRFASITYEVTWKISSGKTTTSTKLVSREIWEREIDGWHRLFAAMD